VVCAIILSAEAGLVAQYADSTNIGKLRNTLKSICPSDVISSLAGLRAAAALLFLFIPLYTLLMEDAIYVRFVDVVLETVSNGSDEPLGLRWRAVPKPHS
jgi:hypothetical protein